MSDRRTRVLDAAITVLGTAGLRQLTHRAADAAADLPAGSTSNLFRTRDALLTGVLDRLLERETAVWSRLADPAPPRTAEEFVRAIAVLLADLTGPHRELTLARHAAFHEAAFRPHLQRRIARAQDELTSYGTVLLAPLGLPDPAAAIPGLMALIDGLLLRQLANPDPDFDPTPALAAYLT
ncbi:TetR/AcrR family transcriptional regulator [Actinocatenispora rupis]|uniref:Putative transcriptional regulator, TetR n=1 Tax=Actinocatenispora rupis TaxID=519421 RepID=A0A8J3J5C8_9ACTN|nr:TetR/AcrR family transcriptional regulator [Actinocatenispora rupis]GID09658.1 putative transcriptional regulator, TetR [Actinocatenispora rupis]